MKNYHLLVYNYTLQSELQRFKEQLYSRFHSVKLEFTSSNVIGYKVANY